MNPHSGARLGQKTLNEVLPLFEKANRQLDIRPTHHTGDGVEIARTANLEGVTGVAVIGGDGTLHEVVNGLCQRSDQLRPPLGLIPCGTGNTVAAQFGIVDAQDAVQRILHGRTSPLDLMHVVTAEKCAYCCNIVGWGAVTDINRTAEKLRWLGLQRYTVAALLHIAMPHPRRLQLTIDDRQSEGEYLFAVACNTQTTGKGMRLAPNAKIDDGLVDLVLVRKTSRWRLLRMMQKIYRGAHLNESCVEYHQVRHIKLVPESPDGLNLDGELTGFAPFELMVSPHCLSVFSHAPQQ